MFSKRQREIIIECFAFTIFFAMISYKLTNAGLWFDETIEYWYSKYFVGALPWENEAVNMYDRIISTYQPPLFNVIFHFWLLICDSEWWLRLFGVLMGLFGAVGLYKTILFGSQSHCKASIAVIIYATIYNLTYYWQEVAEYALMLGFLSWTIYYFLRVINKPDTRSILLFVVFCILPVYSQYGAVFPVIAFSLLAFIKILFDKDKKNIIVITISYLTACVFAALPLYLFFLKPQMIRQGSTNIEIQQSISLKSFYDNFITVFNWNFLKDIGVTGQYVIMIIIIFMIVIAFLYLVKGDKIWMKYLLIANMICYILYYISVVLGFYANVSYSESFGNRYNLFLIPLWYITSLLLIHLFLNEMMEKRSSKYAQQCVAAVSGIVIAVMLCWSYLGWSSLQSNWSKENIRGAAQTWMDRSGYDTDTVIYTDAKYGFQYYVMHDSRYVDSMFDKVIMHNWGKSYADWLNESYEEWPTSVYIVASHVTRNRLDDIINIFTEKGYTSSTVYDKDGGKLIYLNCMN